MKYLLLILLTINLSYADITNVNEGEPITSISQNEIIDSLNLILNTEIDTVIKETITYTGYISKSGSNMVKFKTVETDFGDFLVTDNNSGTETIITFKENCSVAVSSSFIGGASGNITIYVYDELNINRLSFLGEQGSSSWGGSSGVFDAHVGDYIIVNFNASPSDSINTNLSVVATKIVKRKIKDIIP